MNSNINHVINDNQIETNSNDLADSKRKKYRLSKKAKNINSEQEDLFFNKQQQDNNDNDYDENINNLDLNDKRKQLIELKNFKKEKMKTHNDEKNLKKIKFDNLSSSCYKLENYFDLNFKFDSIDLENSFKSSYLSVTRLIYIKYLLYLILFSLTWLLYFICYNQNQIDINTIYATIFTYNNNVNLNSTAQIYLNKIQLNEKSLFLLAYLVLITIIFVLIFLFLFIIEYKEKEYRLMEKKLNRQEMETKVNFKLAETDLKLAMEEVLNKEHDYTVLRAKFNMKSELVNKLRNFYSKFSYLFAIVTILLMYLCCFLIFFIQYDHKTHTYLPQISHFIWFNEIILLFYLIYPFHFLLPTLIGILSSILFEYLTIYNQFDSKLDYDDNIYFKSQMIIFIFIKILLHSSIHLIGIYLKLSLESIKRDTYLKVAHMNKAHLTSQQDKQITERMIKSIMPPLFTHVFGKPEEFKKSVNCVNQMRPLFIYPVSEISILFADIVGFTRMSSNKTAEELVYLLNDLYGRFDKICEEAGCEKISTLGDCYYCVSGCLNGRKDHAKCCVEMGLLMVKEIEKFNFDHNVDVNMRVGVHTGSALCGFIGGKRFRFDVWSSDVTLANKMESSGRPGWVHISEDTYKNLDNKFNTEPGEKYSGKNTYFVVRESKRETVADALKLSETLNSKNMSKLVDESSQQQQQQQVQELQDNNMQSLIISSNIDESKNKIKLNEDDNSLDNAVKDLEFFQPDINLCTMRFELKEERKFEAYILGIDRNKLLQSAILNQIKTSFWTNPQNLLFISMIISFIINLCVSTSFFLTFIASTMSTYKHTIEYKHNFYSILIIYCLLVTLQVALLVFYFIKYSKQLIGSNNKETKKKHDNSTNESLTTNDHLLYNNDHLNSSSYAQKSLNIKKLKKETFKKYILLHVFSTLFLTLVPIYLLATGLLSMCNISDYLWSELFKPILNHMNHNTNELMNVKRLNLFGLYFFFTYTISIINFCSFVQLSSLYKTIVSLIFALIFAFLNLFGICSNFNQQQLNLNTTSIINLNENDLISKISFSLYTTSFIKGFVRENSIGLIDILLLVLLVWFINRHSELIQRLSFRCDQDAHLKITYAKEQKELANWLIEVVLPSHVMSHVKEKKQYSRNYECVGVLFVSLCNFSEFFEESYEGGRELLRVLNEISVDFDRLFDEPKYKNVEKIKSIGSTFMIASGLSVDDNENENTNNNNDDDDDKKKNKNSHLYDLVDFALELYEKLEAFNIEAMSVCHFKFQMRIGFNFGPVTAGVIGTDRLLYDIWGDTVNVASRMDSTGQAGLLQTPDRVAQQLSDKYKFFERGPVQIKGKDQMITYFMNPKENQKVNLN